MTKVRTLDLNGVKLPQELSLLSFDRNHSAHSTLSFSALFCETSDEMARLMSIILVLKVITIMH